ncbi:hypothetical protein GCM10009851_37790 [Herbiconiux moechotypicola]|uniref:Uncharacterized protein n=1 Tax=Herbiconiux moechotypicola TaxID=637393 RepID=A0ABN3E5I1_9MICO
MKPSDMPLTTTVSSAISSVVPVLRMVRPEVVPVWPLPIAAGFGEASKAQIEAVPPLAAAPGAATATATTGTAHAAPSTVLRASVPDGFVSVFPMVSP